MATAKQAKEKRTPKPKYWKPFWSHEYTVTKIDPVTNEVKETAVVLGSRDAAAKQRKFEDEIGFAIVVNNTTGEEEYRTPGCEK